MHECIVTRLTNIQPIKGADRIVQATVNDGTVDIGTVVTSIEHTEGELGLFFDSDLQLSEEYTTANDLVARYDETGKKINNGYLSEKRRITAQKFKGVKSDGLWMPLSSLAYIFEDTHYSSTFTALFNVGDTIKDYMRSDAIVYPICDKYFSDKVMKIRKDVSERSKKGKLVNFPEHADTEQFKHHIYDIPVGSTIYLTEKEHGTSHRVGYVEVDVPYEVEEEVSEYKKIPIELPRWKRFMNWFLKIVTSWPDSDSYYPEYDFQMVTEVQKVTHYKKEYKIIHGTRRVVLSEDTQGYYGSNQFRYDAVGNIELHKDEILYGEIVGWVNDTPIMPPHTTDKEVKQQFGNPMYFSYGLEKGQCEFHIYRITQNGKELSLQEVEERSKELGLKHVRMLAKAQFTDENQRENLVSFVNDFTGNPYNKSALGNHISEGVIVRVEFEDKTWFYKSKSWQFKLGEGIVKENPDTVDIEEVS